MNVPLAGNLTPYVEALIQQKQSIGYPYVGSARILRGL